MSGSYSYDVFELLSHVKHEDGMCYVDRNSLVKTKQDKMKFCRTLVENGWNGTRFDTTTICLKNDENGKDYVYSATFELSSKVVGKPRKIACVVNPSPTSYIVSKKDMQAMKKIINNA